MPLKKKRRGILDTFFRSPQPRKRPCKTDVRHSGHINSTSPKMGEYNYGHHQTRSQGPPAYSDIDTATGAEPKQRELGMPGKSCSSSLLPSLAWLGLAIADLFGANERPSRLQMDCRPRQRLPWRCWYTIVSTLWLSTSYSPRSLPCSEPVIRLYCSVEGRAAGADTSRLHVPNMQEDIFDRLEMP